MLCIPARSPETQRKTAYGNDTREENGRQTGRETAHAQEIPGCAHHRGQIRCPGHHPRSRRIAAGARAQKNPGAIARRGARVRCADHCEIDGAAARQGRERCSGRIPRRQAHFHRQNLERSACAAAAPAGRRLRTSGGLYASARAFAFGGAFQRRRQRRPSARLDAARLVDQSRRGGSRADAVRGDRRRRARRSSRYRLHRTSAPARPICSVSHQAPNWCRCGCRVR